VGGETVEVQVSTSQDGSTYTAWATLTTDIYTARYVKLKYLMSTTTVANHIYIYNSTIYVVAPVTRLSWYRDVAIGIWGKSIEFGQPFVFPPRVVVTIVNGVVGFPVVNNKTITGCDIMVYDVSGSAIGTAEVDVDAKGY
jgi:hypothetical protein